MAMPALTILSACMSTTWSIVIGNLWAAAGWHIIFATRDPDELDAVVEAAGHGAEAASVGEAVARADIIMLAVPHKAEPSIAEQYGDAMRGKVLVNVDNALAYRDGEIAEEAEAVGEAIYSARLFEGTRFIRAFNLKAAYGFPDPGEVESADFQWVFTLTPNIRLINLASQCASAAKACVAQKGDIEGGRLFLRSEPLTVQEAGKGVNVAQWPL